MSRTNLTIREGDVYEVLTADGKTFEIRYGYYEDFERDGEAPIPIYPDLEKTPTYGADGKRIVTFMQNPCNHFDPRVADAEAYCGCCRYYPNNKQMINACRCRQTVLTPIPERRTTI